MPAIRPRALREKMPLCKICRHMCANAQRRYRGMPKLGSARILENVMNLGTALLIILILMLIGVIPTWPHSQAWGYMPSTVLGLLVLLVLVLLILRIL